MADRREPLLGKPIHLRCVFPQVGFGRNEEDLREWAPLLDLWDPELLDGSERAW
eukprot:CAMPEP_0202057474 /NCGR_PEP_ID=MMETSP0963-20130614/28474_1 /ASSEMBLY_ACC=CAM_ASM_000494 /TAXON_ID=4773 /ORGANISM="Schizochytrium aggregatum, Strain ATCC28209" /LENGTH=53 /DNA_ID=CAMNT_0048623335 /DNA_START=108 /DNA_END=266 /DNA_ORIENTATION=+